MLQVDKFKTDLEVENTTVVKPLVSLSEVTSRLKMMLYYKEQHCNVEPTDFVMFMRQW